MEMYIDIFGNHVILRFTISIMKTRRMVPRDRCQSCIICLHYQGEFAPFVLRFSSFYRIAGLGCHGLVTPDHKSPAWYIWRVWIQYIAAWTKWPRFCKKTFSNTFCWINIIALYWISLRFVLQGQIGGQHVRFHATGHYLNQYWPRFLMPYMISWAAIILVYWGRVILLSLSHLPVDKMAAISKTIFSDAFSWMKSLIFWLKFHWSVFLRVQLIITQNWFW